MLFCGRYAEQPTDEQQRRRLGFGEELRDSADLVVDASAAEALEVDLLVGHRLHDVRPGDEHVARPIDHHREISDRRRVDRAAGAWTEDDRQLRHDARRQRVAQENLGVPAQRIDPLLDPGPARIGQTDDRCTAGHRQVHHLADLLGMRFRQRSAKHGEVLGVDEHDATVDGSPSGDDPIAEVSLVFQPELGRPMGHERIQLHERTVVEQDFQPLASRQLAPGMLLSHTVLTAALPRSGAEFFEVPGLVGSRHRSSKRDVGPAGIEPATSRL